MQIEEGKFYRTRDGQKVGPMEYRPGAGVIIGNTAYPWRGFDYQRRWRWWTEGGRYDETVSTSPLDLIAEWTDEQPAVSPTLAQDGETHADGTETAADAETPSTDAGNEKDDMSVSPPSFDVFTDLDVKPLRVQLLVEGAALTHGARDREYGPPALNMACSGELKAVFRKHLCRSITDAEMEALDMALTKVGRLATGNPKRDTYVDAATYMAIAGEIALTTKRSDALSRLAEMDADLIREGE